ncbi:hypothetical protein [Candidatus Cytomitobacter primus]|uniref:Uncharacterized protein n=1 Tax=Candidatus Cytomitobacter primus TaxID=2066024 RepID=A0A5C0UFR3_9PROT|nr:hypothetical protein [Candidatus Cytomitobacter primus]QEK38521.1 hypothetical protein FZC34_01190 [Candidatus Cytomitobacter primus]
MKLSLKYKNDQSGKSLLTNNCYQTLEINNLIRRSANGEAIIQYGTGLKYKSTIYGTGYTPYIKMHEILCLECETRIYQSVRKDETIHVEHKIVPNSLFFQPTEGEIIPFSLINHIHQLEDGEISYRPLLEVVATNLTFETKNLNSVWQLQLEEV